MMDLKYEVVLLFILNNLTYFGTKCWGMKNTYMLLVQIIWKKILMILTNKQLLWFSRYGSHNKSYKININNK